jgi:hypothetical protein
MASSCELGDHKYMCCFVSSVICKSYFTNMAFMQNFEAVLSLLFNDAVGC